MRDALILARMPVAVKCPRPLTSRCCPPTVLTAKPVAGELGSQPATVQVRRWNDKLGRRGVTGRVCRRGNSSRREAVRSEVLWPLRRALRGAVVAGRLARAVQP